MCVDTIHNHVLFHANHTRTANAKTHGRHKPTVMTMAVAMQRLLRQGAIVDKAGTVRQILKNDWMMF